LGFRWHPQGDETFSKGINALGSAGRHVSAEGRRRRRLRHLLATAGSIGCAAYLLCIVLGAPEARRFESKVLQFFGNNGYCLYLTHLPILGLAHHLFLRSEPDLATPLNGSLR
jgi:peptidoglycan/LPS O-acetylase OafA/YrhL